VSRPSVFDLEPIPDATHRINRRRKAQMPTGTPYNSFAAPYRIRVDDFTTLSPDSNQSPLLHLLTHTHSDHINGLSAKTFGYKVYCSQDAKAMLLKHEVYAERELHTMALRAEKIRTYSHLKVDPMQYSDGNMYYTGSRDLLVSHFIGHSTGSKLEPACFAPTSANPNSPRRRGICYDNTIRCQPLSWRGDVYQF
jgi:hypothetical protein